MTTRKCHLGKRRKTAAKKQLAVQKRSLDELALEITEKRDAVESLLKSFALLLCGRNNGRVEWDGPDFCHVYYLDSILLTIGIEPNRFVIKMDETWHSTLKKKQSLRNAKEVEAFLLKLYDEWK